MRAEYSYNCKESMLQLRNDKSGEHDLFCLVISHNLKYNMTVM